MKKENKMPKLIEIIILIIAMIIFSFCFWFFETKKFKIKDRVDVIPSKECINIIFSSTYSYNVGKNVIIDGSLADIKYHKLSIDTSKKVKI